MNESSKAGTYYDPMPLDFEILARIPEKGVIGGVHWKGRRVKDLTVEINEALGAELTPENVAARLRSLDVGGHVKNFRGTGGRIWAKTESGIQLEKNKEAVLNG